MKSDVNEESEHIGDDIEDNDIDNDKEVGGDQQAAGETRGDGRRFVSVC